MRPVEVGLNDGKVYFTKETTIQKEKGEVDILYQCNVCPARKSK